MNGYDGPLSNPQSAGLILNLVLQSVLIVGGSWILVRVLRPGSAPLRRNLLLAGLVMGVVMPPAGLVMHAMDFSWTLQVFDFPVRESPFHGRVLDPAGLEDGASQAGSPAREPLSMGAPVSSLESGPDLEGASPGTVHMGTLPAPSTSQERLIFWMNLFGLFWLGGTGIMLARLAWGWFYLVRFRQGSAALSDPRVTRILRSRRKTRRLLVRTSDLLGSPLTTGFLRPCIMIPRPLLQSLTDEELGAVLAHELAHVEHGDFRVGHFQRLAASLYWWNPFVHALNSRLTAAMEDLCDNQAITAVEDPRSYVECLVNVVDKCLHPARLPGSLGMPPSRKSLETRVKTLLSEERDMRTTMNRSMRLAMILCFIVFAGILACTQVEVQPEEPAGTEDSFEEEAGVIVDTSDISVEHEQGAGEAGAAQAGVEQGLDWLARHQDPEGFWDCDAYNMQCTKAPCVGRGQPLNDVGVTGLALLAFMGSGNTYQSGPHKEVVRKGLEYLVEVQDPVDGCLTPRASTHYMYNHGIASLALIEGYGLSEWAFLDEPARKAIGFIHESHNPGKGWRYNMGDEADPIEMNDVSVTGWMIMSLVSARDFGLPCNEQALSDALSYIDQMTDDVTGRTGYKERGSYSSREMGDEMIWPFERVESMTAVAMVCRIFNKDLLANPDSLESLLIKGTTLLMEQLPEWDDQAGSIDFYYWYYGSLAMFQMGGAYWQAWSDRLVPALLDHQQDEGCTRGSWNPRYDPWGDTGGRVYATAMCTLCLESFYRYALILKK